MIKRISLVLFCACFMCLKMHAQELNLKVTVSTPKLNLVDPKVFKTLERNVSEFINNTKWTNDEYDNHERIEGNLLITIKDELDVQNFLADIRLNTIRPVYGSNYSTPILNFIDKDISFSYVEQQPIEDSRNVYIDNLSSILTYHVMVLLGFDYDTFSELGGEPFFQTGQEILNGIPAGVASSDRNWTALGSRRGRYWIIENALNPKMRNFRKAMYNYHMLSLDKMTEDQNLARTMMTSSITDIGNSERSYPNAMLVQMFTDSKREEIIEIYKEANRTQQNKIVKIMTKIDPARSSDYGIFK